ncbi:MAG: hypothetical protein ABIL58_27810 [Pseudomonadota bacterium]
MIRRAAPLAIAALLLFSSAAPCADPPFILNDDGRMLIQEAAQAYRQDLEGRPAVMDPAVTGYADKILKKLLPSGRTPPEGIRLAVTVVDSPKPELYAYMDGHVVVTTGTLYAMDNEAQLAAVLSPQIAYLVDGYYVQMYQGIKAAERKQRNMAVAGALLSGMLDIAVDYAVDVEDIKASDAVMSGEATYRDTMARMAAVHAAQSAYYSLKDVVESIPAADDKGRPLDPRLRFAPVATAQGMTYLAGAGYDAGQAAEGWRHIWRINNDMARENERVMGAFAEQMRAMQGLMQANMARMQQQLGATGLVQTLSEAPESKAAFVSDLTRMKEVTDAQAAAGKDKAAAPYRAFLSATLAAKAESALADEEYEKARMLYKTLYDKGEKTAAVSYGMAKSQLGDFAFGASEAERRAAEKQYREALTIDKGYAPAYKGLGALYEDWERYKDAATAYGNYLKYASDAPDRSRIERKITLLNRKANR